MDDVSSLAVSASDAVSGRHRGWTEWACRCGADEGFARDRRPSGFADSDTEPCRTGDPRSPAGARQAARSPGMHRGTVRTGPRYLALRIARRARRGGGRGRPPLVHRQAADPARLHIKKVAGRHRTPPRKGKATARRLVQASPAYDRRLARPRGLSGRDSVKTNLTRLRGRTLRGERLTMDAPFGSRGTQTLIAG